MRFLAQNFAIGFVAVDIQRRRAAVRDWRTLLAAEPATRFLDFGQAMPTQVDGHVAAAHDGEPDHSARRAPLLGYLFNPGKAAAAWTCRRQSEVMDAGSGIDRRRLDRPTPTLHGRTGPHPLRPTLL
jgi:hypothetical protein